MIHGLGGSHLNWTPLSRLLAGHGRVVAVDLPGFGLSPPRRGDPLAGHANAVTELITALGGAAYLVGNSMGGLVAEMVSAASPEMVLGQVLIAPASPVDVIELAPPKLTPPAPSSPRRFGDFLRTTAAYRRALSASLTPAIVGLAFESMPVIGTAYLARFQRTHTPTEQVRLTTELIAKDPAKIAPELMIDAIRLAEIRRSLPWANPAFLDSAASIRRLLLRPSRFRNVIESVTVPTLLMFGTEDPVVPVFVLRSLARRRPDWTVVEMDGLGHIPMLEAPATTGEAIIAWKTQARAVGGRGYSEPPGHLSLSTEPATA
jgi:pimeloyl-ACP methyl ester carboxylesterase